MNGGPYGRGKAPERACLPIIAWPEVDRRLWQNACTPGDILSDDTGARAQHAAISNTKAAKGYGRWLTWLRFNAADCLTLNPAQRITHEKVRAYVKSLMDIGNNKSTILARLQELGEVARVIEPSSNWHFISHISSIVRAGNGPSRDKSHIRMSDELFGLGLKLMKQAGLSAGTKAAVLYRDGLLIAFLSLVPLRRRNLSELRLDESLMCLGQQFLIVIDEKDTKTHAPIEVPWPSILENQLRIYLDSHRLHLIERKGRWAAPIEGALWVSSDSSPMTQIAIYDRIRTRTKAEFGKDMSPHLFRDSAATTLAIDDPKHVRIAASLLGHRTFATTEKYYRQSRSIEAQKTFVNAIWGKGSK